MIDLIRQWFIQRRFLATLARHNYGVERRWFESDRSLRARCAEQIDSLRYRYGARP